VHRYTQTDSDFHYAGTFALHDPASPIDITFARVGHEESVLVTQWFQGTSHGSIYQYAPEGKVLKACNLLHIPTRIVFDPASQQIYFGTYDTNELYKVDIDEGRTHEICSIPNAVGLGPLALDSERQMLYAADKQGAIFAVDLQSKRVTQLRTSFAYPAALLFHSSTKSLYVADQVQRKVYALSTSTQRAQVVVKSAQIQGPSGLAAGPGDSLVISDKRSGSVLVMRVTAGMIPM